jgi:hypothetical protein
MCLLGTLHASPATITSAEAAANVGSTVVVRGTVAQVSTVGSGMTFVNFGRPHPNSEFIAVVRAGTAGFDKLTAFEGREVDVEGTIELHRGRPQIVLQAPGDIRLAGAARDAGVPLASTASAPGSGPASKPAAASAHWRAGSLEKFNVPLTDEEKRMAGKSPLGVKPEEATVGIMLPVGFDPAQPQKVLVVFSTDDNGGDHFKAMPRFGGIATRKGWVAIAATGPVLEEKLSPEWHAAMIYAGLRALVERYPDAGKWRYFCGGNSGGGLRSSMMTCALLKMGYPVEGVFMGGVGGERFTTGQAIFRPERAKVRKLAVYLAIGKNDHLVNAAMADQVEENIKKLGFKNIRRLIGLRRGRSERAPKPGGACMDGPARRVVTTFPLALPKLEPLTLPQIKPPYQLRAVLLKDGQMQVASIHDPAVE